MSLAARELTARGRGAISVLELVGSEARARVAALAGGALPPPGGFALLRLASDGELLDEALCLVDGPERLELHLHGSPALVVRVLAALGIPRSEPEPRTLEERALDLLARAPSEAGARVLLDQAEGALRRALAALDPLDEASFRAGVQELLARGRAAEALLAPRRVVLAGPVNAGKSTLFNALVGHERVVVAEEPGTTRDAVREPARLGEYPVELVDVAGERPLAAGDGAEALEAAGQARGRELRRAADLVLWLRPAPELPAAPAVEEGGVPLRVLVSRADRLAPGAAPALPSIAAQGEPGAARRVVTALFHEALELPPRPWTAGAGAAFDAGLRRALGALLAAEAGARRTGLSRLLEGG